MNKTIKYIIITATVIGGVYLLYKFYVMYSAKQAVFDVLSNEGEVDISNVPTSSGDSLNNVGNIRNSSTKYKGEVTTSGSAFKSFQSLAFGYRAMMEILMAYYKQGYHTLRDMISHYAPASDNNPTNSYITFVSDATGISPNADLGQWINDEHIMGIVTAMSIFEQGANFKPNSGSVQLAFQML